ncbi:DUF421 domain-containing protein [Mucilaginibacter ximonensis]|uniref:DUF421 domain-containing protein n=1 Tax=Mucilaginibacter ximonensis TaxID=538021 RepID=A0ABW5YFS1_9SPHI
MISFSYDFWFGTKERLDISEMTIRGVIIFVLALILIRISGRRSFGLRTPVDNIVSILLGAVLSRAVVGASPFLPVVITCLIVVTLHRTLGWFIARNPRFSRFVEGDKILIYKDSKFLEDNMKRVQICREDVMQGIRRQSLTEDLREIDHVYIERNGEISAIRKK